MRCAAAAKSSNPPKSAKPLVVEGKPRAILPKGRSITHQAARVSGELADAKCLFLAVGEGLQAGGRPPKDIAEGWGKSRQLASQAARLFGLMKVI